MLRFVYLINPNKPNVLIYVRFTSRKNLQTEACQLKLKMSDIQKDIFHLHKETNACMANLEHLDSMKNKLQVSSMLGKRFQIFFHTLNLFNFNFP